MIDIISTPDCKYEILQLLIFIVVAKNHAIYIKYDRLMNS